MFILSKEKQYGTLEVHIYSTVCEKNSFFFIGRKKQENTPKSENDMVKYKKLFVLEKIKFQNF